MEELVTFGGPKVQHIINDGSGAASTVADGANVVEGATADSAVITNTTGTLSGKLRGIVAILADIWDSTNHDIKVGGAVATNVAITANPINLGVQAVSSENAAVTTARQVQLVADLVGKLIVLPYANPENFVSGVTAALTDTTSTQVIAAPASGLRNYITSIIVTNSHATVSTFVSIRDGSGGTIIWEGYALAAGGGFTITFPTPLRQPTTATRLDAKCETTGSNVIVSIAGYKGA